MRLYVQRFGLLAGHETVVAAVSGGPDSLAMLHLLLQLAPEMDLRLQVAHLDHGLRGDESQADARFVAELSERWHLPCTVGQADVRGLAAAAALSIEEAARQARYAFLSDVALRSGARRIAVAHTADDQAETVLMHFLRGSGVAGLRGMLPATALADYRLVETPEPAAGLWLIRPLLDLTRAEVEAYCARHNLPARLDSSNLDDTIFRNRLRHELLPELERYNPAIRRVLSHTAAVMAGDYELLQTQTDAAWRSTMRRATAAEVLLDLARWRALPLGQQRATIRKAVHALRRSLRNINWEHIERAVWLARGGHTGQAATLTGGLELQIGYEMLRVAAEGSPWPEQAPQVSDPVYLAAPGVTNLDSGWQVQVERLPAGPVLEPAATGDPWHARLDADATGDLLVLRPHSPGERFQPYGLGGHTASIAEFMINAKVPRDLRAGWPLLAGREGVAWLCGLRPDERYIVRPGTREVWQVHLWRPAAQGPAQETGQAA